MKRLACALLAAGTLAVAVPGPAQAGSATNAALALGSFAVLNQLVRGETVLNGLFAPAPAVAVAPPPVVYAPPPPPPVVVVPPPPPRVVYYAPPPAVVYAPPPTVVYAPAPRFVPPGHWKHWRGHGHGRGHWGHDD